MSITERFREFGIVLAIGAKNIALMVVVFFETLFLSLIGIIIGDIFGYLVNYYIILHPIEITGDLASIYEEYGFKPIMYSSIAPEIFISVSLTIIIVALASYFYPAYRLYKLEALKGIRYT